MFSAWWFVGLQNREIAHTHFYNLISKVMKENEIEYRKYLEKYKTYYKILNNFQGISDATDIPRSNLSDYGRGKRVPKMDTVMRIIVAVAPAIDDSIEILNSCGYCLIEDEMAYYSEQQKAYKEILEDLSKLRKLVKEIDDDIAMAHKNKKYKELQDLRVEIKAKLIYLNGTSEIIFGAWL